jgi:uncharacterized protein YegL
MTELPGAPLIALLVDRSGSMVTALDEMQAGLNDFVAEQAELPGDAALMLAQFDTVYQILWPMRSIKGAPTYRLEPRGRTALCDAIGSFINDINERLAAETTYRPVVCVILTDGKENASQEWDRASCREWIHHMREHYHWQFVFLGANLDAEAEATTFGIPVENALTFDVRRGRRSYALLSRHVATLRAGQRAIFSADDRRKAIEP